MKNLKKVLSVVLAACMTMSLAACGGETSTKSSTTSTETSTETSQGVETSTSTSEVQTVDTNVEPNTYTYVGYDTALGNNWNPHTWETNSDDSILSYLSSPFVDIVPLDTEEGVYQWAYIMADAVTDVTATHQDDLTKYGATLPTGKTAEEVTEGFVYQIDLNKKACWENGTPINADSYIYSMKQLLDPKMKNYRSNLYWSGESAVAGGLEYYYSGDCAYLDNGANAGYTIEACSVGEDGVYVSPDGNKMYIGLYFANAWCGGDSIGTYVDTYGADYFDTTNWEALTAMVDDEGLIPLTDETYALFVPVTTGNPAWGESEADVFNYFVYAKEYPEVDYDETVGCYKVDDYTIIYVNENYIDFNYFLTSLTSTWLVYEDLYEAGKDTTGDLVTTNYGTSIETTMSYGPYKLKSLQADKQVVFVQNENWYGYTKDDHGSLVSYTENENFKVNGENVQQYQSTSIVINVMDDDAAKQAFLKGELSAWTPSAEELVNYAASDQLYKQDETYTQSFFFNTDVDMLKEMDNSKGNTNSVVLSNTNFRKAMSLSIDRAEYVTATPGYKPAYEIMNNLYFYDVYNDPTSSYRNSDEAMQAICNLYGVEYGEGKAYATLKDAYKSINGYNLTEAKALMATACQELTEAGLYTAGEDIVVRIGWMKGALDSAANNQVALINKYVNAALEGSGFGKITFEAVGNIDDRYSAVPGGEYAIGYGAWGGAAFYPFRNFQVYCDPDSYSINEIADWDPTTENLTLNVNGEDVTMTWQAWSNALTGGGVYTEADFATKLAITADMEEEYLKKFYRIPLCGTTICELLSYQNSYFTEDYNVMYSFGGLRLLKYNYSDAEWAAFVNEQGGTLSYE